MKYAPSDLNALIRNRRSVFPNMYREEEIPRQIIEEILENANWAPTHRKTEPWRFKVFAGAARKELSDYLANYYEENTPTDKFSELKLKKTRQKPLQASHVLAICMQRDPEQRVPEWEEIAAVACAVQNMWLTCTAYGIGSYWSSPASILNAQEFLQLNAGERCLGLFYMGLWDPITLPAQRSPMAEKTTWF